MTRSLLLLLGLAASGLGIASLLRPAEMAALTELPLTTAAARIDFRAVYGGAITGVGLFLLGCALRRDLVRTGLMAAACLFGGAGFARLFAMSIDGFGQPLMVITMLLELVAAGLAAWGVIVDPSLIRLASSRSSRPPVTDAPAGTIGAADDTAPPGGSPLR